MLLHTCTMQKGRRSRQESSTDNPLNLNQRIILAYFDQISMCFVYQFSDFPDNFFSQYIFSTPLPMERVWRRQSTYLDIHPEKEREEEGTVPPLSCMSPLDREKKGKPGWVSHRKDDDDFPLPNCRPSFPPLHHRYSPLCCRGLHHWEGERPPEERRRGREGKFCRIHQL